MDLIKLPTIPHLCILDMNEHKQMCLGSVTFIYMNGCEQMTLRARLCESFCGSGNLVSFPCQYHFSYTNFHKGGDFIGFSPSPEKKPEFD